MKVLKQFSYTGKYRDPEGTEHNYSKKILIVQRNEYSFPQMVNLPADTPDLTGKNIEITYTRYFNDGKATYKATGYKVIG